MDAIDVLRMLNACLSTIALIWLVIDSIDRARLLTVRRMYLTLALMAFLVAVMVGSVEQIIQDVEPGIRGGFTTAACVWTLVGLWLGRNDDQPITDQDAADELRSRGWTVTEN